MKTNDKVSMESQNPIDKSQTNNLIDMDNLINNLKNEDARNLRLMKSFKWIFIVLIVIYSLFFLLNPDPELVISQRISGLCYIASCFIFALIFRHYHKEYREIDYSLPLAKMLKMAVNRYKLNVPRFLIIIPPLVLMDAGLTLTFSRFFTTMSTLKGILIIQAFYIPIMLISAFIGVWIWKVKQKPLKDGAIKLLEELNE